MTVQPARRAPLELYGTVNAIDAARIAAELHLAPARRERHKYACVKCGSSDAMHRYVDHFHCFACNERISNVDAAAAVWGVGHGEACLMRADRLGVYVPDAPAAP